MQVTWRLWKRKKEYKNKKRETTIVTRDGQKKEKKEEKKKKEEETAVEDEGVTPWPATCVGNLLLQLGVAPTASSSSSSSFFPLQIRNLWNEEEDDEERWDYFGFGDLWVWFVLGVYCVWRNLWDEEEDDKEGDGEF